MLPPVAPYDGLALPFPLRPHQQEALDAVERALAGGSTRLWVTMPPGAGKTYVGTEVARRLGRRVLVLSPNTAITTQWARTWESYGGAPAGNRRDLRRSFTSLTYQSLAVFDDADADDEIEPGPVDPAAPATEAPASATPHLDRLHPNGRELVETNARGRPLLLVLDECHHLMEVWGELLREVLDQLPEAVVLGLTATPPASMTRAQAALAGELFGPVIYEARIPALVTAGTLAPYAELAWLVEPTPRSPPGWPSSRSGSASSWPTCSHPTSARPRCRSGSTAASPGTVSAPPGTRPRRASPSSPTPCCAWPTPGWCRARGGRPARAAPRGAGRRGLAAGRRRLAARLHPAPLGG